MTSAGPPEQMSVAQCSLIHAQIHNQINAGFVTLEQRLEEVMTQMRETNGRLRAVEQDARTHEERWRQYDRRASASAFGITSRDVWLVCLGAGAVLTLLGALRTAWPLLHRAFMGP